jgi:hypothetical protein
MKIGLTRSGGFAGMSMQTAVDTGDLPPDQAELLTALAGRLRASASKAAPIADGFQYDFTIADGRGTRHVRLAESELTPEARELVERLTFPSS